MSSSTLLERIAAKCRLPYGSRNMYMFIENIHLVNHFIINSLHKNYISLDHFRNTTIGYDINISYNDRKHRYSFFYVLFLNNYITFIDIKGYNKSNFYEIGFTETIYKYIYNFIRIISDNFLYLSINLVDITNSFEIIKEVKNIFNNVLGIAKKNYFFIYIFVKINNNFHEKKELSFYYDLINLDYNKHKNIHKHKHKNNHNHNHKYNNLITTKILYYKKYYNGTFTEEDIYKKSWIYGNNIIYYFIMYILI